MYLVQLHFACESEDEFSKITELLIRSVCVFHWTRAVTRYFFHGTKLCGTLIIVLFQVMNCMFPEVDFWKRNSEKYFDGR